MKRRSMRKTSAATFLVSPPPTMPSVAGAKGTRSPTLSPPGSPALQFDLNFNGFADFANSLKKSNKSSGAGASGSKMMQPTGFSPSRVNTISDLKDLVTSNLDSIKRQLERSHFEISKDVEANHGRLQKRLKVISHDLRM